MKKLMLHPLPAKLDTRWHFSNSNSRQEFGVSESRSLLDTHFMWDFEV